MSLPSFILLPPAFNWARLTACIFLKISRSRYYIFYDLLDIIAMDSFFLLHVL